MCICDIQVYPDGPWRPSFGVQRGSVQFNSLCAGDPSRAYAQGQVRNYCGYDQEDLVPSIPVLPISYGDAEPFLKNMGGISYSENFQSNH